MLLERENLVSDILGKAYAYHPSVINKIPPFLFKASSLNDKLAPFFIYPISPLGVLYR